MKKNLHLFVALLLVLLVMEYASATPEIKPQAEPFPDDSFTLFLENPHYVSNIELIEGHHLAQGNAAFMPWSGSYWPIHKGILANRYADPGFPKTKSFIDNYSNYVSRPSDYLLFSGNINALSPAEKYDLLVGDHGWTLTQYMWNKGLRDYQEDGTVATWTGICHGWAAATHMNTKSPVNPVTVTDVHGVHSIKFYANDIKALLSYAWAEQSPTTIRAGNRCRQSPIARDAYLRPIDPSCLDSNPMTWHLAMVNRIGLGQNSLVMDASNGPEVWNYPITGYDYSYFNPRTFETSHSLKGALVPIKYITADRFAGHRSPKAKYLVGVVMDVFHPALIEPSTGVTKNIVTHNKTFVYDLELDQNLNVVGGEWYSKDNPDFLWTFPKEGRALTREDVALGDHAWNGAGMIPGEVAAKARTASARGKVLSTIAQALLSQSLPETRPPEIITPPGETPPTPPVEAPPVETPPVEPPEEAIPIGGE